MGMPRLVSKAGEVSPPKGDPNPLRFTIIRTYGAGLFTAALVNYPDATTYGGDKVLVFNLVETQVRSMKAIDPHFTGVKPEPLVRFRGDKQGWDLAVAFVDEISMARNIFD